jgi:hypothetical protein
MSPNLTGNRFAMILENNLLKLCTILIGRKYPVSRAHPLYGSKWKATGKADSAVSPMSASPYACIIIIGVAFKKISSSE